jgi:nucleoside phosphorylase
VPNNKNSTRFNEIINNLNIKIGVLACGSFVLKSGGFLETKSKEINDKIIGFEMESYGVMRATKYLNNSKNLSLVVKSVMDYTDEKKSDSVIGEPVKSIAAYMSYLFVRVLIPYIDDFYKKNILK